MNHNPVSVEILVSFLVQGYSQLSLAYEDLAEQMEKKLRLVREELGQGAEPGELASVDGEIKRLQEHIATMNGRLDTIKNQIAANLGMTELPFEELMKASPGLPTWELEKMLEYIGQLMARIHQAAQELEK